MTALLAPAASRFAVPRDPSAAARRHVASLAELDEPSEELLRLASRRAASFRPRQDLVGAGQPLPEPRLILSGWAARVRILADGSRQLQSLLLPGDVYGARCEGQVSVSGVTALTAGTTCAAPRSRALDAAYAVGWALDESYLLDQVTRLGRMSALHRLYGLALELLERLGRGGSVRDASFRMPLTQEMLADVLGLTPVHVNRTMQSARRAGAIAHGGGVMSVPDPDALSRLLGRAPTRVAG